jgi:hypothetical protein
MTVKHETTEPSGAPFPNPHYVFQTVDPERPIRMTFFYQAITRVEDLDGKKVPQQTFLDRRQRHYFNLESEDSVYLVARVLNPRNLRYKIYCNQRIEFSEGGKMESFSEIAYSDMKYREFNLELPLIYGIKSVEYTIKLMDENGNPLITTGNFYYHIK